MCDGANHQRFVYQTQDCYAKWQWTNKSTNFHSTFQALNGLIDDTIFDKNCEDACNLNNKDLQKVAVVGDKINVVICSNTIKSELAQFYHGAFFSPVTSTWKTAINKGFLTTCPGLDFNLVDKHLPPSIYTCKGHLNQERKFL